MRRTALLGLLAALLPLTAVTPASAANELSTSMPGGVLYEGCGYHEYSYSAALPPGYTYRWEMDMQLLGPDGLEVDTDFLYTSEGLAGVADFFICDSPNLAGTYTIQGAGEACNSDYMCVPITTAPSTTTFRLPQSRTMLRAKPTRPAKGQVVRFRVESQDERPTGYFGSPYATVKLQINRGGAWRTFEKDSTNDSGKVMFKARYSGRPVRVRAVTESNSDITGSMSRTIRIR